MNELTLGTQYKKDTPFRAAARLHQSRFRSNALGVHEWRNYGSRLPEAAALDGKNFFDLPAVREAVSSRFGRGYKKIYWDMLASDHIPFNFFVPLRDNPLAIQLFSNWVGVEISEVLKIKIECAPKPRELYLDDMTSFDVYIEYETKDKAHGVIGVEVKYTEEEYGWGKSERARMFDSSSPYHRVHTLAGIYSDGALVELATPELKQFWRNQLLGESMLQQNGFINKISTFTSVLLHPAGNEHFGTAAVHYSKQLLSDQKHKFVAVTYEDFIASSRLLSDDGATTKWLDYLEARYIVC